MKNRIKQFLEGRGLSAYQFIKETGIAPATGYKLAKDETHLPAIRVLEVICDTYRVQPSELIEWVDEDLKPEPAPNRSKAKTMQREAALDMDLGGSFDEPTPKTKQIKSEAIAAVEDELNCPIEALQVSVRTQNKLKRFCCVKKVNTVRELVSIPKKEILSTEGLGKAALAEVSKALEDSFGITEWE